MVKKYKNSNIQQSASEQDSFSEADIDKAIQEQKQRLADHKNKGSDSGKKSNKGKRVYTGFCLGMAYLFCCMAGPSYLLVLQLIFCLLMSLEILWNLRDPSKDNVIGYWSQIYFEIAIFTCMLFILLPQIACPEFVMFNSGMNEGLIFGTLFNILQVYYAHSVLVLVLVVFLWFLISLRRGSTRYQYQRLGFVLMAAIYISFAVYCTARVSLFGRAWTLLSMSTVQFNDVFAYLVGMSIGRTQLIQLSPNKTVEGFLGGAIISLIIAFQISPYFQLSMSLSCPLDSYLLLPFFEPICSYPEQFSQTLELPTRFLGLQPLVINLYTIACCFVGLFTSFCAVYGGFFNSGLKRSYKFKDFSDILPGHGGCLDRTDCTSLILTFTYLYLSATLLSDHLKSQEIVYEFTKMDVKSKANLLAYLQTSNF